MEDVLSSNNENIYTKDREDIFVNNKNVMLFQMSTKAVSHIYTRLSDMSISLMLLFSMKRMSSYLDSLWIKQVFPSLVSCKKWKSSEI